MITRPLELESRMRPPPHDLNAAAWVNVGLIALFFGLLGSRFVLAPGMPVGVGEPGVITLPATGPASASTSAASVVVSYRRDNVILFEGGMFTLTELRKQMQGYLNGHPGAVMLVRADRQVSMQAFLDLCEMARSVGFANVLVAAEPPGPDKARN